MFNKQDWGNILKVKGHRPGRGWPAGKGSSSSPGLGVGVETRGGSGKALAVSPGKVLTAGRWTDNPQDRSYSGESLFPEAPAGLGNE